MCAQNRRILQVQIETALEICSRVTSGLEAVPPGGETFAVVGRES